MWVRPVISMCMSMIEAKIRYGSIWRGGSMVAAVPAANIMRARHVVSMCMSVIEAKTRYVSIWRR